MNTSESTLGRRASMHNVDSGQQNKRLVWAGLCVVIEFMFVASTKAAADPTPGYELFYYGTFAVVLILPLIAAFWFLSRFWKAHGKSIALYDEGLVQVTGDKTQQMRWQEISSISVRRRFLWQSVIAVEAKDGTVITIEMDYHQPLALANTVLARAGEVLTRQYLAAYERGETITLGQLAITLTGIQQNGQSLAWADIQDWQFGATQLMIRKKDGNLGMIVSNQTPNVFVLSWLLYAIVELPMKHPTSPPQPSP
jgi:hypothetical protein